MGCAASLQYQLLRSVLRTFITHGKCGDGKLYIIFYCTTFILFIWFSLVLLFDHFWIHLYFDLDPCLPRFTNYKVLSPYPFYHIIWLHFPTWQHVANEVIAIAAANVKPLTSFQCKDVYPSRWDPQNGGGNGNLDNPPSSRFFLENPHGRYFTCGKTSRFGGNYYISDISIYYICSFFFGETYGKPTGINVFGRQNEGRLFGGT